VARNLPYQDIYRRAGTEEVRLAEGVIDQRVGRDADGLAAAASLTPKMAPAGVPPPANMSVAARPVVARTTPINPLTKPDNAFSTPPRAGGPWGRPQPR
jgi:hypothetical protein